MFICSVDAGMNHAQYLLPQIALCSIRYLHGQLQFPFDSHLGQLFLGVLISFYLFVLSKICNQRVNCYVHCFHSSIGTPSI